MLQVEERASSSHIQEIGHQHLSPRLPIPTLRPCQVPSISPVPPPRVIGLHSHQFVTLLPRGRSALPPSAKRLEHPRSPLSRQARQVEAASRQSLQSRRRGERSHFHSRHENGQFESGDAVSNRRTMTPESMTSSIIPRPFGTTESGGCARDSRKVSVIFLFGLMLSGCLPAFSTASSNWCSMVPQRALGTTLQVQHCEALCIPT